MGDVDPETMRLPNRVLALHAGNQLAMGQHSARMRHQKSQHCEYSMGVSLTSTPSFIT